LANVFLSQHIRSDEIEPISRIIGIPHNSFKEFNTRNIEAFNASVPNKENVKVIMKD
jgi:hypothetical protein